MSDLERTLLDLEQHWLDHHAEDFTFLADDGFIARQEILEIYAEETSPERRNRADEVVVKRLGDAGAVIAYKLTSTVGDESHAWYVSTAYRRTPDGWRAVLRHDNCL
jgi:hypothetical protein